MEFNLYHFPDYAFHVSRFLGQDTGVLKLGLPIQVHAVLAQPWLICLDDKA
jgi:hypothetical protein